MYIDLKIEIKYIYIYILNNNKIMNVIYININVPQY
jgi:hypothetical protein